VGIVALSYALPSIPLPIIRKLSQISEFWKRIGAPLMSFTLHDLMQLYRTVAMERRTQLKFRETWSMPVYIEAVIQEMVESIIYRSSI